MTSFNQMDAIRAKVDELNSEAWAKRVSDSTRAFTLSREAVELARQAGYSKGLAEGLRSYGFGLIRLSRHQEAMPVLEESFALFEALGSERGKAEVYEYFGIVHRSFGNFDRSLENLYQALDMSLQAGYKEEASLAYYHLGVTHKYLGNFDKALEYLLESLAMAREIGFWVAESYALNLIGQLYSETGDYRQALDYYHQSLQIRKASGDLWGEAGCLDNIGYAFLQLGRFNEAVEPCAGSLAICRRTGDKKGQANALFHLSALYGRKGEMPEAVAMAKESLAIRKAIDDKKGQAEVLLLLAGFSLAASGNETIEQLQQALIIGNEIKAKDLLANIHFQFYQSYKALGRFDKALESFEAYNRVEKELHKDALAEKVINLQITHRAEQAQKEAENYRLRNNELAALYEELKRQKEETEEQRKKAEQALVELRSAQAQLIQREKMASLGELTAGVAHEIQNPLNFVNNFAEVNKELVAELKQEASAGRLTEVLALACDLEGNEEKIMHHGRKADAIVKGMLQHSRGSNGMKEPTNINTLADEYLRLSNLGLKAKDKSFQAAVALDFDADIGAVDVVPQDIGRVLLNLYNNAFYSVNEKKKCRDENYTPLVSVRTKKAGSQIEVSVKDNGTGIPPRVMDKIFQPFFTTKPTGEGTGLGLSLCYEIITNGHGGAIRVESTEGEGAEFTVLLPLQPA